MLVVNLSALKAGHQFRVWSTFCELWWKGDPTLAKAAQQHTQQTHVCCFSISLDGNVGLSMDMLLTAELSHGELRGFPKVSELVET